MFSHAILHYNGNNIKFEPDYESGGNEEVINKAIEIINNLVGPPPAQIMFVDLPIEQI
jgi:hypothetical protein